jgi:mannose/fructose/N-acetylgalactosamine-specific phosphotransferase system component IID/mannose/fructose/N-acetylgalactosamine-specific phosphotransferase system component IIC
MVLKYLIIAYIGALIASTNGLTGQALTNRPIVLGPFVGLVLGDVVQGTIIGASLELAYMGVMVIGISTAVEMRTASLLGTTYALVTGQGADLAITLAVPASMLFTLINNARQPVYAALARVEITAGENGQVVKFERWHWIYYFLRNIAIPGTVWFVALLVGSTAVQAFVDNAPTFLINGLSASTKLIPALGFAMLFNLCYTKEVAAFFYIGFCLATYMHVDNVGVAIMGGAFAAIAYFFTKTGGDAEEEEEEVEETASEDSEKHQLLDEKTLEAVTLRSYQLEADFSMERFQGTGFGYSMIPALKVFYKDRPEEFNEALSRHIEFFNTTPTVVTLITGIALALEEEKATKGTVTGGAISSVKVALMGPAAGIGDAIFWGSYRIICASIACELGVAGNLAAPWVFLVLFNIPNVVIHHYGLRWTYKLGSNVIRQLYESGLIEKITLCCSIMGMTMVGAMTGSLVSVTTALEFSINEQVFKLQEVLDSIMPNLLSLVTVLILSRVMKKETNVVKVIFILMAVGILGALIGFF